MCEDSEACSRWDSGCSVFETSVGSREQVEALAQQKLMNKILIIEDSADVRSLISDMLSINDYDVVTAENGLVGLDMAQQHLPDLIICDVHMPELDGFETLAKLRENPATSTIPFIFLTGVSEKPTMRHGMELGADDYLTKPFTMAELLATVKTRIQKKAVISRHAEQKLEELRGNISMALPHELLTPITGILGFSSILVDDAANMPPAEISEAASNIHSAAIRLRRTIENFLLYSQIEVVAADAKRVMAVRQARYPVPSAVISDSAQQAARRAGRERDLVLHLTGASLALSPEKLDKVIHELLDNAFKFSDAGKSVTVSSLLREDSFLLIIDDQGRGFTPEQVNKIGAHMQFERKFYEQQGSGLGLIITKRLIELHGGELAIESVPNSHTRVLVTLPATALVEESLEIG